MEGPHSDELSHEAQCDIDVDSAPERLALYVQHNGPTEVLYLQVQEHL